MCNEVNKENKAENLQKVKKKNKVKFFWSNKFSTKLS